MSINLVSESFLGSLYGSLYFATVVSSAFYGVTCMQAFFYYVHYQDDPLRMKILVATIWTVNTIHEALSLSGAYKYTIAGLVNPPSIVTVIPELVLQGLVATLAALPTQGFFVYRIYVFSQRNIIAPIIWIAFVLVMLVCSISYPGKALYSANGVHVVDISTLNHGSLEVLATVGFSAAAAVDILIAISMTLLLVREQTTTSFTHTVYLLQRLTMFAVNTGIWTAMFALLAIILLHLFPTNLVYAVFAIPLCSVYCNTLLANLNARAYLRDGMAARDINLDLFNMNPPFGFRQDGDSVGKPFFPVYQTKKAEVFPQAVPKTEVV